MTGVGGDSRGRFPGAPALVVGFTLAAGATLALVFTEDLRWLRLAIVAALWAALIGAFVAVRYRKQAAATAESVAQAQAVYELELEREIAARREFELEIEAETRDRVEADSREELDALRDEITALRESLQSLFGGEVLYERVALTAQSTRMRSLNDEPKVVTASEANGKPKAQLTSGAASEAAAQVERPTEMIDKIRDGEPEYGMARRTPPKQVKPQVAVPRAGQPPPRKPQPPQKPPQPPVPPPQQPQQPGAAQQRDRENAKTQQVPRAPRPVQPPQDSGPPTRRVPLNEIGSAAAKAAKAASEARADSARTRQRDDATMTGLRPPHVQQPQQPPAPPRRAAPPAAARQPEPQHPEPQRPKPPQRQPEPSRQPGQRQAGQQREPERHELTRPSMEQTARGRSAASVTPPEPAQRQEPVRESEPKKEFDFEWMSAWTEDNRHSADNSAAPDVEEVAGRHGRNGYGSPEPEPVPEAGAAPEVPEPNPTLPESVRELQHSSRPGGRRRRAEDDEEAAQSFGASRHGAGAAGRGSRHGADEGGGRRRRADGEPPWQGFSDVNGSGAHGSNGSNGSNGHTEQNGHSAQRVNGAAEIDPPSTGRRAAGSHERPDRSEPESGSHAEGRSVSELLAAHGSAPTPRRRRRAED